MADPFRVLLVADTHLGLDEIFFSRFRRALEPALRGEVDAVVHGGDVFYRSKIPPALVQKAFEPLAAVGARGVPVLVVPGNHERSHIPYPLFAVHRNVFVFDRPRTFVIGGVAFSGFPYARDVRARFGGILRETRHHESNAATRLLCFHHAVEGAKVGTPEFVFTDGPDVIRGSELPAGFAAILSGHIHRGQRLSRGLDGTPFAAPVFYPGSVERTSMAERYETKGYLVLHLRGAAVERFEWRPF